MSTRLSDPFRALLAVQAALDSARDSAWLGPGTSAPGTYPPINVFSQGDDLVVIAELPGVHKESLDLEIERNQIRLSGAKAPTYGDDVSVHRRERRAGSFSRVLTFPVDIDAGGVKAECRDGILAIFVPRAAHERARKVKIA
ncbi:MAG: Hsp20/alpha crystallin family protein [Gammaproteobacteria bacterium]|nr:Hsp20/alpha crystallin family protein [Gammaproteobacteria bacterium]